MTWQWCVASLAFVGSVCILVVLVEIGSKDVPSAADSSLDVSEGQ